MKNGDLIVEPDDFRTITEAVSSMIAMRPYAGRPRLPGRFAREAADFLSGLRKLNSRQTLRLFPDATEAGILLRAVSELQQEEGRHEEFFRRLRDAVGDASFIPAFADSEALWLCMMFSHAQEASFKVDGKWISISPEANWNSFCWTDEDGNFSFGLPGKDIAQIIGELRNRAAQQPGAGTEWDEVCNFVRSNISWLPASAEVVTSDGYVLEIGVGDARLDVFPDQMSRLRLPDVRPGEMLGNTCFVMAMGCPGNRVTPMVGRDFGNSMKRHEFDREDAVDPETAMNALYGMETVCSVRCTVKDLSRRLASAEGEELDGFGLLANRELLDLAVENYGDNYVWEAMNEEANEALISARKDLGIADDDTEMTM